MRDVLFDILICGRLSTYLNQTPHKGEGEVGEVGEGKEGEGRDGK